MRIVQITKWVTMWVITIFSMNIFKVQWIKSESTGPFLFSRSHSSMSPSIRFFYYKTSALNFFHGTVTFSSAQGSEVTATFSSYAAVPSDNASGN